MQDKSFSTVKIKNAVYIPNIKSLYIRFEENVVAGYDTKEYVNVDKDCATGYKNAEDKDTFYRTQIKNNYKFRYCHYSDAEIYLYKHFKVNTPKTYAEYMEEFKHQQELKDNAAFNAIRG